MGKKSKGRRKIEMKKLQDEDKLHVAFSKRRSGLIKLANEFSILTGAEISLLVFSPGDRVYPFGTPDPYSIIQRYENQIQESSSSTAANNNLDMLVKASSTAKQQELNCELSLLEKEVVTLRRRGKLLDLLMEKSKINSLENQIKDLDLNKLEDLLESAKELKNDFEQEIEKKNLEFSQRIKVFGMNEAVPSLFDLFRGSSSSSSRSDKNGNYVNGYNDIGTAGVVQFAGPSRINNHGGNVHRVPFHMTPGASSSM